jgi:hypothetical protein
MGKQVQITDPTAVAAVQRGEVEGEVYRDGEVWADEESLRAWVLRALREEEGKDDDEGA